MLIGRNVCAAISVLAFCAKAMTALATDASADIAPAAHGTPGGLLAQERFGNHGQIALRNGNLMLVGSHHDRWPSEYNELIETGLGRAKETAKLPAPLARPSGRELIDGSIVVFGGTGPCQERYGECRFEALQPSYRYWPSEDRWAVIESLRIPFSRGDGDSDQPRNDAIVSRDGNLVWLEQGQQEEHSGFEGEPATTELKRWRPNSPHGTTESVATTRKARVQASLIELDDGRLVAVGGQAQLDRVALEKDCTNCPDEYVSLGPFRAARSTEVLDFTGHERVTWRPGPAANFGGGRAVKLANGKIFKLAQNESEEYRIYRAELTDASFTRWDKLPPVPLEGIPVSSINVIGNRVLLLTESRSAALWNDDTRQWRLSNDWPQLEQEANAFPLSVTPLPGRADVLVRYKNHFQITRLPEF